MSGTRLEFKGILSGLLTSRDKSTQTRADHYDSLILADHVGAEYPVALCDLGIFVNQATGQVPPKNPLTQFAANIPVSARACLHAGTLFA